jgi:hypothetical protein
MSQGGLLQGDTLNLPPIFQEMPTAYSTRGHWTYPRTAATEHKDFQQSASYFPAQKSSAGSTISLAQR